MGDIAVTKSFTSRLTKLAANDSFSKTDVYNQAQALKTSLDSGADVASALFPHQSGELKNILGDRHNSFAVSVRTLFSTRKETEEIKRGIIKKRIDQLILMVRSMDSRELEDRSIMTLNALNGLNQITAENEAGFVKAYTKYKNAKEKLLNIPTERLTQKDQVIKNHTITQVQAIEIEMQLQLPEGVTLAAHNENCQRNISSKQFTESENSFLTDTLLPQHKKYLPKDGHNLDIHEDGEVGRVNDPENVIKTRLFNRMDVMIATGDKQKLNLLMESSFYRAGYTKGEVEVENYQSAVCAYLDSNFQAKFLGLSLNGNKLGENSIINKLINGNVENTNGLFSEVQSYLISLENNGVLSTDEKIKIKSQFIGLYAAFLSKDKVNKIQKETENRLEEENRVRRASLAEPTPTNRPVRRPAFVPPSRLA